ncbi:MAG TPA: hypothetical protein VHZ32_18250, partial [Rhizomicrobium sp.]|nr:hypothetical protein [Rhizomicrobium sp.]
MRPFVFAILSVTAMDRAARAESCELARLLATVEMRSTEPQSNIHTVPVSLNGVTRFMVLDTGGAVTLIESTPIDYLDFASPESGLGSKIGLDATN